MAMLKPVIKVSVVKGLTKNMMTVITTMQQLGFEWTELSLEHFQDQR